MNRHYILAAVLLVCGIALLGYSVSTGEGTAGVFLIFPVFYGSGLAAFLGVLCIIAAIFVGIIGFVSRAGGWVDEEPRQGEPPGRGWQTQKGQPQGDAQHPPGTAHPPHQTSVRGGGVVLLGPIPIIFGSDKKMALILAVLALCIIIAMIFLMYMGWLGVP